tara:strand:+ start:52244 stop:54064 length:1821 start_codon:yes stop_codon:yes gene_type:complete
MSQYIPENNYLETKYTPVKGFTNDLCTRCETYYKGLFDKGLTKKPFPPNCSKSAGNASLILDPSDFDTVDEFQEAAILLDPIAWAQKELDWEPRFYQEDMIYCTSQYKLNRLGRRSGKTEAMVVETLHHAVTNKNHSILIIAPYERQVARFFDEMNKFINMSVGLQGSLARYTKTPSLMQFNNGTKILGFSAGATSGSGSDKIRGQDAHLIIIDEIDTLENKDIDAVLAILASHKDCRLIASTTPRGWRRRFYTYVTDKDLGFKEFWFISAESPEWSEATEQFFRGTTDPVTYTQEYLADFAELQEGVFKSRCLDKCVEAYDIEKPAIQHSADYIMGIDWNKSAGTHMVILEWFRNKLKLVKKIIVPETEYLQTESVDMIINLNRQWKFKYIFVDAGYGSVQVELLKKHALVEPSSLLDQKLFAIAMNQHLKVTDPITGEEVKRSAKHFLVEQTKKLLEDGFLILPKVEDTTLSTGSHTMGLIQQMRNFRVEATSVYGLPRYSQGDEHTLTAYYLACGGFYWKEGDLKSAPYVTHISSVEVSDEINQEIHPSVIEREQDARSGWNLVRTTSKNHRQGNPKSRSIDVGNKRTDLGGRGGNGFNRKKF